MDDRIVPFISGVRGSGVRRPLAESQDAFRAVSYLGVARREAFKSALRTTLVKERSDLATFEELFPKYFRSGGAPPLPASEALSPDELDQLRRALQMLAGELHRLLEQTLAGHKPSTDDIAEARA